MRETIITSTGMGWRSQRFRLAEDARPGRVVLTVSQLAARLAGGFLEPAARESLLAAAREALLQGQFQELGAIADLPGMPGAVMETLSRVWLAALDLGSIPGAGPRLHDLALLERRILQKLPPGQLSPPALAAAALANLDHAAAVLGEVRVRGVWRLDAVWRALFLGLASRTPVRWELIRGTDEPPEWMAGTPIEIEWGESAAPRFSSVSCATPRHEATEALRWARNLIATGQARPEEVAIAAVSLDDWEDALRTFAGDSNLPIHFVHGRLALSTFEGQQAASLAAALRHRPSEANLRRLNALLGRQQDERITQLPSDAAEAGRLFLKGRALALWERALLEGPPEAVATNLAALRTSDGEELASRIAITTASELAASPRRFVWLLGLNSRKWPRGLQEDRLLPAHIVPRERLCPLGTAEIDRRTYRRILATTSNECVASFSRRGPDGRLLGISPLVIEPQLALVLQRSRVPEHAFSESDRLLARPAEFASTAVARSARQCWSNWHSRQATPHDGLVRPDHPAVLRALERVHSASSLRKLLRDPLGFVWGYCLNWQEPDYSEEAMELDPLSFGTLVHDVLANAVKRLESDAAGWKGATPDAVRQAVEAAAEEEGERWKEKHAVPPCLLWLATLADVKRDAYAGLLRDGGLDGFEKCFTEIAFGQAEAKDAGGAPWDPALPVRIGATGISIGGRIDRLDLGNGSARVTDYKTGKLPESKDPCVLDGGAELQRCLYACAVKTLLPDVRTVESRLVYLKGDGAVLKLERDDLVLDKLAGYLSVAKTLLAQGLCLPGKDAEDDNNRMLLALPANARGSYFPRKSADRNERLKSLAGLWEEQ